MSITVRELTHDEIRGIWPFIKQLNPKMEEALFQSRLERMLKDFGYRCAGAYDESGKLVGISGFWVLCRFWCGHHVDIDNVIVDESARNRKVGQKLMQWIENWAREQGFDMAVLDAYTHNKPVHRFYIREGFEITGFHFTKDLKAE